VIRHPRARLVPSTRRAAGPATTARAIGVCASTGGPQVLASMLRTLPEDYPVPLLVVQHIAEGFTTGFARWLDGEIPLSVDTPEGGEELTGGVWIAPEGAHLILVPNETLELDRETVAAHRPSGDVLLRSLAATVGSAAVGVVLTGMGRDGAEGLSAIRAAEGLTIAQDEQTSAVYGMPQAAADSADLILPPQAIGERLAALQLPAVPV
jgi:two-component system chemotaxis response regulator CheB